MDGRMERDVGRGGNNCSIRCYGIHCDNSRGGRSSLSSLSLFSWWSVMWWTVVGVRRGKKREKKSSRRKPCTS